MRRFILVLIFLLIFSMGFAISRTWTGGASGNWGLATNWIPNGAPAPGDDLTINSNAIITIDIAPSLSSLLVTGNTTVIFTVINSTTSPLTRIFTPVSTATTVQGFKLDAGSTLVLQTNIQNTGSANISLRFGAGVHGLINGNLIFNGHLTGPGNPLTTLELDAASNVQVNGLIQFDSASANISGASATNLFFNTGSIMEIVKNGGSFPVATWHPNSLVRANNATGANPPIFNGNSYGNLEWNCPAQNNYGLNGNVSFNNARFITTGSSAFRIKSGVVPGNYIMTINGSLTIETGSVIEVVNGSSAPAVSSGKIVLKGDLDIKAGGGLITSGGALTTSQLEFSGTSNQNIAVIGNLSGAKLELIMNGVSATLLNSLTLPGDISATSADLQLLNGKIITTSSDILIVGGNSTVSGGSLTSFITGPMQKNGNADFTFPVGKGSIYAPLTINNVSGTTADAFVVEYIRGNPQSTSPYGPYVDASSVPLLDHVSLVEYWTLEQIAGPTASKLVSVTVNPESFCLNIDRTYVSRWNGSFWTNEHATIINSTNGYYQTGTIKSTNTINGFTSTTKAFTLSTDLPFSSNPLPITLLTFEARRVNNTEASLKWTLAEAVSQQTSFELERATDGQNFSRIAVINGLTTDPIYHYSENGLRPGINYYRLRMIDENGSVVFSRIAAVMNGVNGLTLTSLIPTVVSGSAMLTIASSRRQQMDIVITDIYGRTMKQYHYRVQAGNTTVQLLLDNLTRGTYQLSGVTAEGRTNVLRFIKQ